MNELEEFERKMNERISTAPYEKCLEKHPEYKYNFGVDTYLCGENPQLQFEYNKRRTNNQIELYEISKKEGLIDSIMSFEEFLGITLEDIKHNYELFNKLGFNYTIGDLLMKKNP